MDMNCQRPVWAEIDLDKLKDNISAIREYVSPKTKIMAVVKADGYGHGSVEIGDVLLKNGADLFAVSTLNEALILRRYYPTTDILILGYTPDNHARTLIENNFIQTIYDAQQSHVFNDIAKKMNRAMRVHIKIDTGMGRLGIRPNTDGIHEIYKIFECENMAVEGIYTHFSTADWENKEYTYRQNDMFWYIITLLENKGLSIPFKHVSNSSAIIDLPQMNYDMVRAGVMLYGIYPSDHVKKQNIALQEVMALKSYIAYVKNLPVGSDIGYGRTYTTTKESKIATLPVGYADGYTRLYAGDAKILYGGHRYPIVGSICMDQCMVDMSGSDAKIGEEVTLIGKDGNQSIAMEEMSTWMGTIPYETMCMIGKRVPRVYKKNGCIVNVYDAIISNKRKIV